MLDTPPRTCYTGESAAPRSATSEAPLDPTPVEEVTVPADHSSTTAACPPTVTDSQRLTQGMAHQLAIICRSRRRQLWCWGDTETARVLRRLEARGYATIVCRPGCIRGDITDAGRAALAAHEGEVS